MQSNKYYDDTPQSQQHTFIVVHLDRLVSACHISLSTDLVMTSQQAWWDAFPAARLTTEVMPRQRVYMILSMRIANLLIIDVRRDDYAGGSIRGSLNIPAQGFWWNRGMLYVAFPRSAMLSLGLTDS